MKHLLIFVLLLLTGCGRSVFVPVESVRTEYRDRDVWHYRGDTIRERWYVYVNGDTVLDVRRSERTVRETVHDTVYIERTDSVDRPYPVERSLSRWEQAKMDLGGIAMGAVCVVVIYIIVWLAKKKKRL